VFFFCLAIKLLQILWAKAQREKLFQSHELVLAGGSKHVHGKLGPKLANELATDTTGATNLFFISDNGNCLKFLVALGHGFDEGGALSTDPCAIGRIFNVATGDVVTIFCQQDCADPEVGVRCVGFVAGCTKLG
jgi:hypothetical protein